YTPVWSRGGRGYDGSCHKHKLLKTTKYVYVVRYYQARRYVVCLTLTGPPMSGFPCDPNPPLNHALHSLISLLTTYLHGVWFVLPFSASAFLLRLLLFLVHDRIFVRFRCVVLSYVVFLF
ncbi:unnamed protein product, partial [Pylaiella littoralis]